MLNWLAKVAESNAQLRLILLEIPCFMIGGIWMSVKEILGNDFTIFNSQAVRQIIPVLDNIGIKTTTEKIEEHEFYALMRDIFLSNCLKTALCKIQNGIWIHYNNLGDAEIHSLFECISSDTAAKEGVSVKDIKELALLRNRHGQIKTFSQLIELDPLKYKNIVDEFIISEKDTVCPGVSSYLMPLQQAYKDLILPHWDELTASVIREDQSIALYTLVSDLYSIRKNSATNSTDSDFPITKYYYANGKFLSSNEVCVPRHTSLSETELSVLYKCVRMPIVSNNVLQALKHKPFQPHNTNIDTAIKVPVSLSQEEIEILLEVCKKEHSKFFNNFLITNQKNVYHISPLPKGEVTYKSKNAKLVAFIDKYCTGIHHLPDGLHEIADFPEILIGDQVFTSMYPYLHEANGYQEEYLTLVEAESSLVKREFLGKLLHVDLFEDHKKNDQSVRILRILSSVENITNEEYKQVREKLMLVLDNEKIPIINIRMQRDLSVGNKRFSMASLLPEEDKTSSILSNIISRLKESGLSTDYINSLFDIRVDDNVGEATFNQLSLSPLSNGLQLAFVLEYSEAYKKTLSRHKVINANDQAVALLGSEWIIDAPSFINIENSLPTRYKERLDWLTIPFESNVNSVKIRREIADFNILKSNISDEEKTALLDHLYNQWEVQKSIPSPSNLKIINERLGLSSKYIVLSEEYALEKEQPDSYIQNWTESGNTQKTKFLVDVLSMEGEESYTVRIRKYLSTSMTHPDSITKSDILSGKIVDWIVEKSLLLNEEQSTWLIQSLFSQSDFSIDKDDEALRSFSEMTTPVLEFDGWRIYRYPSRMPFIMKLYNPTPYLCRKFFQNALVSTKKS